MTTTDEWGRVPLHYAALEGTIADIAAQLATTDVNVTDNEGWTPLHFAASMGLADNVKYLLDHGADIDAVTEKGMPAIYWAVTATGGDPVATIRTLRAYGADPRKATIQTYFGPTSTLEQVNEWGKDPIRAEFSDLQ
ncbi:ankyrin repeat domain-containing protein [Nocardia thailandica]|uniref:ankyrin repeat domain-containing protein n=1 Tax=Nocardia thailandica TaxID=257275 RepID=UPI000313A107|nr:ankyrin repeat domain-containing protein [Nocardia thailandica]